MNKELKLGLIAAFENKPSTSFSAEEVNEAAVKAIMAECGLNENSTARDFRNAQDHAFALIEEAMDEILPKKLENVLGEFAEVKQFARDAEVLFNIEKIGKNRAKLTISKGARGGIYRAAKLDNKYFSVATSVETVAVYVTLEDIILGNVSLAELYSNVLEGFEEIVYKEVFNALAQGQSAVGEGYNAITKTSTTKATLSAAIDEVMPVVKAYGVPTIFGSYSALSNIYNPLATSTVAGYTNSEDSLDIRNHGFVQVYKGVRCVELPNYLVDNNEWFYDDKYVFVIPSGVKPVKVALKGDLTLVRNVQATGSEKWEAHKLVGVGLAMANNYASITVTDL